MRITRAGLIAAIFVATFAAIRPSASVAPAASMIALPLSVGELTAAQPTMDAVNTAATLGADEYIYRIYSGATAPVEMDVAYYSDPRVGRVMHSPLNCLPGNGWRISGTHTLNLGGDRTVRTLIAERGETRLALMYWYQSPTRVTGSEIRSRINLLIDGLAVGRRDAALVRLVVPLTGSPQEGTETLTRFATQLIPQISQRFL